MDSPRLLRRCLLAALSGVLVASAACRLPNENDVTAVVSPDYNQFKGVAVDGTLQAAGVSRLLERRCATLDCHGQVGRPLRIYGPTGIGRRVEGLFSALYEQSAKEPQPHPVEYVELTAGLMANVGGASVVPVSVPHVAELMCFAYRIEIGGKSILYSGDTGWHEELARQARGVDLFLCECSTYDTRLDIHVSYPEVAARAARQNAQYLELMATPTWNRLNTITKDVAWREDLAGLRQELYERYRERRDRDQQCIKERRVAMGHHSPLQFT